MEGGYTQRNVFENEIKKKQHEIDFNIRRKNMNISGIVPIIATPFLENGEIDYDGLCNQLVFLKKAGCKGATLFGIAGEYYKLTDEECEKMIKITVDECKKLGLASVVSCTCQSTFAALDRAKMIENMGADCMMLLPPFILKPCAEELVEHIRRVCRAVNLPVMLQYAPEQTGVPITPDSLKKLAFELSNLIYFKIECKPAGPYISNFLDGAPATARVFNGNAGFQIIETYDRGAVGCMPGASMAKIYVDIDKEYKSGNREKAVELHNRLLPMLNHIRQNVDMIIHFEKKILKRKGIIATDHCRHPEYISDMETDRLFEMYYEQIKPYI